MRKKVLMKNIKLKARAKINLGLDVLSKRDDGYHEVRMIMQTIGLYDRIIIKKIKEPEIKIVTNLSFLPVQWSYYFYFIATVPHPSKDTPYCFAKASKLSVIKCDFINSNFSHTVVLPYKSPYIAPLTITPRQNPRLYAQQGQFLVTNVADVESFICKIEKTHQKKYLVAADVPIACGSKVLEDLAFMGLTAATMFPGLDGVCRMMKHAMAFKRAHMPPPGTPSSSITMDASPSEE